MFEREACSKWVVRWHDLLLMRISIVIENSIWKVLNWEIRIGSNWNPTGGLHDCGSRRRLVKYKQLRFFSVCKIIPVKLRIRFLNCLAQKVDRKAPIGLTHTSINSGVNTLYILYFVDQYLPLLRIHCWMEYDSRTACTFSVTFGG